MIACADPVEKRPYGSQRAHDISGNAMGTETQM